MSDGVIYVSDELHQVVEGYRDGYSAEKFVGKRIYKNQSFGVSRLLRAATATAVGTSMTVTGCGDE